MGFSLLTFREPKQKGFLEGKPGRRATSENFLWILLKIFLPHSVWILSWEEGSLLREGSWTAQLWLTRGNGVAAWVLGTLSTFILWMGWWENDLPEFNSLCSLSAFGEMKKGEFFQANLFSFFMPNDSKENFYNNSNSENNNNNNDTILLKTYHVPDIKTCIL